MANEQDNKSGDFNKFLILNIASTIILLAVFFGVMYFTMNSMLEQKISKIQISTEEVEGAEASEDEIQRGIIIDLGDFILNLCDEAQKKYLKVNVAVEVTQKEDDFPKEEEPKGGGGHGGHGGHGAAPAKVDPMEKIQKEMNQFKPAIRDAIITNLSSKTSAELASAAGKELAKEQIANDINTILAGDREVLRVSFGQFIIQ